MICRRCAALGAVKIHGQPYCLPCALCAFPRDAEWLEAVAA